MHERHGKQQQIIEYGLPLLFFVVWSLIFSWPLLRYFTSHLVSDGGDARHNLWVLWHVKEAILAGQPLWELPRLYYPLGASLLTHGLGPVTGILALPFWPWGPEAAHNGAVLLSLVLTGYTMYLLARSLNVPRDVALFAGLFLLAAPMHLVGLHGHMTKVFMATIPLVLLCYLRALDPAHSLWWAGATGAALLLTLLHNGYQFVFTALLLPCVTLIVIWRDHARQWRPLVKRLAAVGLSSAILVGPVVLANQLAASEATIQVNSNLDSLHFQPDALELFLPNPGVSRFFGAAVLDFYARHGIGPTIETAVYLSWVGILLGAIVLWRGNRQSRGWLLLSILFAVLALGPRLQILGRTHFTEHQLPLIMPYALLTALPGLDFMRVPGRFMMVGYVVWALTASLGLLQLLQRWPRWRRPLLIAVTALLLIEFWPVTWPVEALRPVPDFYQELANDDEMYGVLDLPVKPTPRLWYVSYSSYYQMYQMTHRKGIANGYISRTFDPHPLFPCIFPETTDPEPGVFVNDAPVDCRQNLLFDLATAGYRYVVWHKPHPDYPRYKPGSWGEHNAALLVEYLFNDQPPLVDDDLVQVYAVPSPEEAAKTVTTMVELGEGWHPWEDGFRWATSPAVLSVWSPYPQPARLEIVPEIIYVPQLILGTEGRLYVAVDDGPERVMTLRQGEVSVLSLDLVGGWQQVQLRLDAGNFSPYEVMGTNDRRELSFSVRSLNLRLLQEE